MYFILVILLFIFAFVGSLLSFFIVHQQTAAIVERLGRFHRIALPGLHIKIPLIDSVVGLVTLRLNQLDLEVETKTKDNVFVKVHASIQHTIVMEKVYEAFYTFDNPEMQIQAFVFDVIRSRVPHIMLDDVFSKKDDIAVSVREELHTMMHEFGFNIVKTLVTDIIPDAKVKAAMNEINESQRLRMAAIERGEADKILKIKQAEADAESKKLQGMGIANQRKAIVEGLQESLCEFHEKIPSTSTSEVLNLMLVTQYFDTLRDIGHQGKSHTIFLPHSPAGIHDMATQMRDAIMAAQQAQAPDKA